MNPLVVDSGRNVGQAQTLLSVLQQICVPRVDGVYGCYLYTNLEGWQRDLTGGYIGALQSPAITSIALFFDGQGEWQPLAALASVPFTRT